MTKRRHEDYYVSKRRVRLLRAEAVEYRRRAANIGAHGPDLAGFATHLDGVGVGIDLLLDAIEGKRPWPKAPSADTVETLPETSQDAP